MTYWLGIDLGTTYTAAALCRPVRGDLDTHVVQLGSRSPALPSVLFLARDGSLLIGEAAEHSALTDPDRVVREFKRRIGDEIPLMVGGVPWQAHELAAVLVHRVWQWINEREAELPAGIALTCPASWGPFKVSLLEQAVSATRVGEMTRLGHVELLSEPQAAAIGYASREHVETGAHLAVYDLGGGTFDAAVIRKDSPTMFTLLGRPEGIDGLGGVTFDEMLFEHVCAAAGVPLSQINPNDPRTVPEAARLRRECTVAKEALSVDTETTVGVTLGGVRQRVRLTRAEFEEMIRPDLDRTIEALYRALETAGVDGTQLDAILLAGGSSKIPLVSQLVSAEFGRVPAIDPDPKLTVAMGAARYLAPAPQPAAVPAASLLEGSPLQESPLEVSEDAVDTDFRLPAIPPARPRMATMLAGDEGASARPSGRRRRHSRKAIVGAAAVILVVAGTATALAAPHLTNDVQPSAATPVTTSSASTPVPSQSASFIDTKPSKTAKAKSSASSAGGSEPSQGKAGSSLAAVPGPSATMPTTAQSSAKASTSPTPTRTYTHTAAPTSPAPTTSTPTSPTDPSTGTPSNPSSPSAPPTSPDTSSPSS